METTNKNGLLGMLLDRLFSRLIARFNGGLRQRQRPQPRLALVERVTLAPRQSLALVEAEGRKFLVATSQDSGTTFFPLSDSPRPSRQRAQRVSW